jgi:hypothetical protein
MSGAQIMGNASVNLHLSSRKGNGFPDSGGDESACCSDACVSAETALDKTRRGATRKSNDAILGFFMIDSLCGHEPRDRRDLSLSSRCQELERAFEKQHWAIEPYLYSATPKLVFGFYVDHEPVVSEPEAEVVKRIVFEIHGPVFDRAVDIIDLHGENLRARK